MDCQDFKDKELVGAHFVIHRETVLEQSKVSTLLLPKPTSSSISQLNMTLPSIFPLFEVTFKPLLFEKIYIGWAEDRRETSTLEYLSLQFGGWEVIKYINHVNNKHLRNVSYFPLLPIARLLNLLKIFPISFL